MALEFVLNIDEVIFNALAPAQLKVLIAKLLPLPVRPWVQYRGLDVRAATFCGLVALVVLLYSTLALHPQASVLLDARAALCAGHLDFVYSANGIGSVVWADAAPTGEKARSVGGRDGWTDGADSEQYSFAQAVLTAVIRSETTPACDACFQGVVQTAPGVANGTADATRQNPCCLSRQTKVPALSGAIFSVAAFSSESALDALQLWNPGCVDLLTPRGRLDASQPVAGIDEHGGADYLNLVRGAMGDAVDASLCDGACPPDRPLCRNGRCVLPLCDMVAPYCQSSSVQGVRARQLCPLTCGCADPLSTLVLFLPESGCGGFCQSRPDYAAALATMPCADLPITSGVFADWLREADVVAATWPSSWAQSWREFWSPSLRQLGCGFLVALRSSTPPGAAALDLCLEGTTYFPLRPLSYYCPVSCGCRAGEPHCSGQCPSR